MVFGCDNMIFNLISLINWKVVSARKQQTVDKANVHENSKRIDFDYKVGLKAYIVHDKPIVNTMVPNKAHFKLLLYINMSNLGI